MPENQTKENNQQPPRKETSRLKVALIIVALLLALLVLKVILILTAKPTISVNYVAELNRISKPADYDPNQNAAYYYEKASVEYVERPESLMLVPRYWRPFWPGDTNESDLKILRQWLEKNTIALDYFKIAAQKQYLWVECNAKDNYLGNLKYLEPENFELFQIMALRAKLRALDGEFNLAMQDSLTCWKMAAHYTNPKLWLMEQLRGSRHKEDVLKDAFMILDRCNLDSESLQVWHESWQEQFRNDQYKPGFQTEKLYYYDLVQRCFTDDGRGDGRLTWSAARGLVCPYCTPLWITIKDWFTGPSRREITELVNVILDDGETAIRQTPWQRHIAEKDSKLQKGLALRKDSPFDFFIPKVEHVCISYHRLKAQQQSLITVIAILRYKSEQNKYPATLEQLAGQKYLTTLPDDPFSDGHLIYKRLDDNFRLYSFGKDFEDSNGVPIIIDVSKSMPRVLGFHPQPLERLKDIVYWPVKRLEKTVTTKKSKLK